MPQGVEAVEEMGPQIKGVINFIKKGPQLVENSGYITDERGKAHFFNPFSLASFSPNINSNEQVPALMEEFSRLPEKSKVVFNSTDKGGAFAMHLVLDTSKEVESLVPKTEATVAGILNSDDAKNIITGTPECSMEDGTFHIDSTSWNTTELVNADGNKVQAKVSIEGDVWELGNGEQFFTPASMLRETIKVGRDGDIMNAEQAQWLLKNTPNNIPDECTFSGFIDSKGQIHFS